MPLNFHIIIVGAVRFISEPDDQTVREGETAMFDCDFDGSDLTPSWRINDVIYFHTEISYPYSFNDQDFSLTVFNVTRIMNASTFQCIVGRTVSREGHLIIQVQKGKVMMKCTISECWTR